MSVLWFGLYVNTAGNHFLLQRLLLIEALLYATCRPMHVLATLLNLVPFGVVVVKAGGQVLSSNFAADQILAEGTSLFVREGKLAAHSAVYQRALMAGINQASRARTSCRSAFSMVRAGQPPVSIAIAPVTDGTANSSRSSARRVLVLMSDPMHDISADSGILGAMFDFTPAESLIARQLVEGKEINDVAKELALSAHTVRNHLKRLFSKTNTNKQCQLLYILLRSPAALRLRSREAMTEELSSSGHKN